MAKIGKTARKEIAKKERREAKENDMNSNEGMSAAEAKNEPKVRKFTDDEQAVYDEAMNRVKAAWIALGEARQLLDGIDHPTAEREYCTIAKKCNALHKWWGYRSPEGKEKRERERKAAKVEKLKKLIAELEAE